MIKNFKFLCAPEVIHGENSASMLADVIKSFGAKKLLIVVDNNFAVTEPFKKIRSDIEKAGIDYAVYDGIKGEPDTDTGDECGALGKKERCDIVCGIGGGSALDTAKAASVLISNDARVRNYQGMELVPKPGVPKIMVPTTAGTGSEVTFTAVFIRKDEKKKGGINSKFLYPDAAILDPLLTLTVPPAVTASTGLDALCHAVESFISRKSSFLSESVSLGAIKLIWENLVEGYENGSSIEARKSLLYGSFLAGTGLANAGVTAVHSISYPLGGTFNVPHGLANGLLLPYVLEFDMPETAGKIARISDFLGIRSPRESDIKKAEWFIGGIKDLLAKFKIPSLRELGITRQSFATLAEDAMKIAVPIENNPKPLGPPDIVNIYKNAF